MTISKEMPEEPQSPSASTHSHRGNHPVETAGLLKLRDLLQGVPTNHPLLAPAAPLRRHRQFQLQSNGDISGHRLFRKRLGDRVTPDAFISLSRGQRNVLARRVKAEASGSDYGLDSGTLAGTAMQVLQLPGLSWTRKQGCGAHQAAAKGMILPAQRKGLWPVQVFKHPTRVHHPPTTVRPQNWAAS